MNQVRISAKEWKIRESARQKSQSIKIEEVNQNTQYNIVNRRVDQGEERTNTKSGKWNASNQSSRKKNENNNIKKKSKGTYGASLVAQWQRIHQQCRRCGCNPWVGKIPWRGTWQPTPVFLPGEPHGERRVVGHDPWGRTESDTTEATECTLTQRDVEDTTK